MSKDDESHLHPSFLGSGQRLLLQTLAQHYGQLVSEVLECQVCLCGDAESDLAVYEGSGV